MFKLHVEANKIYLRIRNTPEKYLYWYSPMQKKKKKCLLYPVKQTRANFLGNNVCLR